MLARGASNLGDIRALRAAIFVAGQRAGARIEDPGTQIRSALFPAASSFVPFDFSRELGERNLQRLGNLSNRHPPCACSA